MGEPAPFALVAGFRKDYGPDPSGPWSERERELTVAKTLKRSFLVGYGASAGHSASPSRSSVISHSVGKGWRVRMRPL